MAPAQSKRQSRKRRRAHAGAAGPPPAAPPLAAAPRSPAPRSTPPRPERRSELEEMSSVFTGRTYGERPPSYFAPVPVSEIAILAGAIGAFVGFAAHARTPLIVGIVVCVLGVLEFTVREHFAGYRSHAALLAAVPAVAIVAISAAVFGTPRQRGTRELLLAAALPVFALFFWLLRKRFLAARQARIVRPSGG